MSASRRSAALASMVVLTALVFALAAWAPWHSVLSVDNRTYVEMVRGVADTGLPCLSNGPAERMPELQARFNRVHRGRLCGTYAPLFAYAAQPAFRLGGLRGVIRFNVALLAAVAWAAWWLGRRLTRDPTLAAAGGWLAVTSAPLLLMGSDASSYTLGIALSLASSALAIEALERPTARARTVAALAAGASAGLAIGTQFLVMPMALATVGLLGVLRRDEEAPVVPRPAFVAPWSPSFGSFARGIAAVCGAVLALSLVAWINRARFGTLSPLSTGACVWRSCEGTGIARQDPVTLLRYAWPTIVWGGAFAIAWRLVARSNAGRLAVLAVFMGALVPRGTLHDHTREIARLAWNFIVDISKLPPGDFTSARDGLGVFLGPFVVRASMQGAPAIALALAFVPRDTRERRAGLIVAGAAAALYASLALRVTVPRHFALGFPFVTLRYVSPAVPLLLVLALAAVRDLPWRRWHLALGVALAVGLTAALARGHDDLGWTRRFFLLRALPAAGLATLAAAVWHAARPSHRIASPLSALSAVVFALGVGATLGVDGRAIIDVRGEGDARVDAVARVTPRRFAIIGWPREIDTPLALRASRDIEYADLYEAASFDMFRLHVDRWTAEHRPVFALWPTANPTSPWPEIRFVPVDAANRIFKVEMDRGPQVTP